MNDLDTPRYVGRWIRELASPGAVLVAAGVLTAATVVVLGWGHRVRVRSATRAVWLAITPPPGLPPDGALGLWQALYGILWRVNRHWRWPKVSLALEFLAAPDRIQAGIWIPPQIPARSIAHAITRAWPGAHVHPAGHGPTWLTTATPPAGHQPDSRRRWVTSVTELAPAHPWTPLIDPTHTRPSTPRAGGLGEEPLRAVLASLAQRRPGERACAQLVVTTGPAWHQSRSRAWWVRALATTASAAATLLTALAGELVHALTTPAHPTPRSAAPTRHADHTPAGRSSSMNADPGASAAMRARETKRAAGPHLHATLRVALYQRLPRTSATRRQRRRGWVGGRGPVADLAAGYDLITTALHAHHQRRTQPLRLRAPGAGFAATLSELGALWHLPHQPLGHHMAAPRARTHRHGPTIDHLPQPPPRHSPHPNPHHRPGHRARPRHGEGPPAGNSQAGS